MLLPLLRHLTAAPCWSRFSCSTSFPCMIITEHNRIASRGNIARIRYSTPNLTTDCWLGRILQDMCQVNFSGAVRRCIGSLDRCTIKPAVTEQIVRRHSIQLKARCCKQRASIQLLCLSYGSTWNDGKNDLLQSQQSFLWISYSQISNFDVVVVASHL